MFLCFSSVPTLKEESKKHENSKSIWRYYENDDFCKKMKLGLCKSAICLNRSGAYIIVKTMISRSVSGGSVSDLELELLIFCWFYIGF